MDAQTGPLPVLTSDQWLATYTSSPTETDELNLFKVSGLAGA